MLKDVSNRRQINKHHDISSERSLASFAISWNVFLFCLHCFPKDQLYLLSLVFQCKVNRHIKWCKWGKQQIDLEFSIEATQNMLLLLFLFSLSNEMVLNSLPKSTIAPSKHLGTACHRADGPLIRIPGWPPTNASSSGGIVRVWIIINMSAWQRFGKVEKLLG